MWLTYDEQFEIISIGLVNLGANKRDQVVIQIFVCICLVFKISSFSPTYMQLFFFFLIRLLIWFCQVFLGPCRIQFLDQGSNPGPQHWECGILHTGPPGRSLYATFVPFCLQQSTELYLQLFIYLWLHWVSIAACGLPLVVASVGLLIVVASLVAELGMWPQQLCMGLVAPLHVGSSQTTDGTYVPCIDR